MNEGQRNLTSAGDAIPRYLTFAVVCIFSLAALFVAAFLSLRYNFARDEGTHLIQVLPATTVSSHYVIRGRVISKAACSIALYSYDGIQLAQMQTAKNNSAIGVSFSFSVKKTGWPEPTFVTLAECPDGLIVHRGRVEVPRSGDHSRYINGVGRVIHVWFYKSHADFYGVVELPANDPRIAAALSRGSLDQITRQLFGVSVNYFSVYQDYSPPQVHLSSQNGAVFFTLKEVIKYSTLPTTSEFVIRTEPIGAYGWKTVDDLNNIVIVTLPAFAVRNFSSKLIPLQPGEASGLPSVIRRDGEFIWRSSVYRQAAVAITVQELVPSSLSALHNLLRAELLKLEQLGVTFYVAVNPLSNVASVAALLMLLGLWRRNESYCGVLLASAFAGALGIMSQLGAKLVQVLDILTSPIPFHGSLLQVVQGSAVIELSGSIALGLIVACLAHFRAFDALRSFSITALGIFVICLFGSVYDAMQSLHPVTFSGLVAFGSAARAVAAFILVVVAFRPSLAAGVFTSDARAARWLYGSVVFVIVLSSVVMHRHLTYGPPGSMPYYSVNEATIAFALVIPTFTLALPTLWFLCAPTRVPAGTTEKKGLLALAFAILALQQSERYLGIPISVLVAVATVFLIALKPAFEYVRIITLQGQGLSRTWLTEKAIFVRDIRVAKESQNRLWMQFLSGDLSRDECETRKAALAKYVDDNTATLQSAMSADATELAFGMGPESNVGANARLASLLAIIPACVITVFAGHSFILTAQIAPDPFLQIAVEVTTSILAGVSAGLGFGLAYPYLRSSLGTFKVLWVVLALCLAILPYEFLEGSRSDGLAWALRWLLLYGFLGIVMDLLSTRYARQQLGFRDILGVAGLGNFAAASAVVLTIITTLLTDESRSLLASAIHSVLPNVPP